MKVENKRILVLGMARSGIAAAELLLHHGAVPVLADNKPEDAFGSDLDHLRGTACIFRLGEDPITLRDEADILLISPGGPIDAPVVLAAKEKGIPVQVKRYVSGGNDAGSIHKSGKGVKTIALSAPTRYLHSPACVASLKDYDSIIRLTEEIVRSFDKYTEASENK